MGFFQLFMVAAMPIVQVLIICLLGALLASESCNILSADARKHMNKVVFIAFTPSLMFANLARTVTLRDIISWWFMPVNIGLIFLIGGTLGWIVVKMLRTEPYLEGFVIAACSAGNFGNLLLIVIPAICDEPGSPFGEPSTCRVFALSYASFSMALGGFYTWTHTFHLIKTSSEIYNRTRSLDERSSKLPNSDLEEAGETSLLKRADNSLLATSTQSIDETTENQPIVQISSGLSVHSNEEGCCGKLKATLCQILEELMAPPSFAAIMGFVFGSTPWLRALLVGAKAPLKVILDSIQLMGDGTIPCITLIMGGNLTRGLRESKFSSSIICAIVIVRYLILPVIGMAIVKLARELGFLSRDPLYQYVLMVQYTIPPAMNLGTMTQLFDVGQEECSVLFLWTYLFAALAITFWSTIFMWVLS